MRLVALVALSCAVWQCQALATESDVIELTEENFKSKIAEGDWMVEIYAPWSVST